MKINVPKEVQEIISVLQEHGHDAYAVGGCVRDSLPVSYTHLTLPTIA